MKRRNYELFNCETGKMEKIKPSQVTLRFPHSYLPQQVTYLKYGDYIDFGCYRLKCVH